MGFRNEPIAWSHFEGLLSDRAEVGDEPAIRPVQQRTRPTPRPHGRVPYAELHAHSHYSFLDGASSPVEFVDRAVQLGLEALALVDHDGLYGAVRFAEAADAVGLPTVFGAELTLETTEERTGAADPPGEHVLVLARDEHGYRRLAAAITDAYAHPGAVKAGPRSDLEQLAAASEGSWLVLSGCRKSPVRRAFEANGVAGAERALDRLVSLFGAGNVAVELTDLGEPLDAERNAAFAELATRMRLPLVATTNAHVASPSGRRLGDAVAAVRARRSIAELDAWLPAGGVPALASGEEMAARFAAHPQAVSTAAALGAELAFSLRRAKPALPHTEVPAGHSQDSWLRALVEEAAVARYRTVSQRVRDRIEHELRIIEQKEFAGYFLIVHDIASFAREQGILCQGRGSAVASVVCFVLGITAIDPVHYGLPFERFISMLREEEPDIDIDFDADRREEVIQYVYRRYGRRNAAQVANVITYRPKSAVRDAAKALGFSPGQQTAWSKRIERMQEPKPGEIPAEVLELSRALHRAPRHLGIHSGGMVLTREPVGQVCPIEPARMPGRTVLQWDKDDCEWMGLVKFDLLGLGMLGALQHTIDIARESLGEAWELASIPLEEPGVYDMLATGDAVGVFQVESRAQLATLPRMRPRSFHDLAIEVALIRPGPIQGDAVHPYLRRRSGSEPVAYAHESLEPVLARTLGVPIFQEQLMQMSVVLGGLDGAEADTLRRAMGSKRGIERIETLREKLFAGMAAKGIVGELADVLYRKIEAFADFGFAESHALAFAKLVYVSAWCKLHYPAGFLAGLLRAQPMGFWSPQSLVADARRHGVEVLRPDIARSGVDAELEQHGDRVAGAASCLTLEQPPVPIDPAPCAYDVHRRDAGFAVRLGLAGVTGIGRSVAERIVAARAEMPFTGMDDLARRARLGAASLEQLASAGALDCFGIDRRQALWLADRAGAEREEQLPHTAVVVQPPLLPTLSPKEQTALDIWSTGVSVDDHPIRHLRGELEQLGVTPIVALPAAEIGRRVLVAGIVTHRQRPKTATGLTFMNVEDETGMLNVLCSKGLYARFRTTAQGAPALILRGHLQHGENGVLALMADHLTALAADAPRSRDFR